MISCYLVFDYFSILYTIYVYTSRSTPHLHMLFSADAKADKMNASAAKAAKNKAADSLIGLWTGIDHYDGSTIRLSISCDSVGKL